MKNSFFVVVVFVLSSFCEDLRAQYVDYVAQPGDTVSAISERFLNGSARWSAIRRSNPGINIHKLQPGQIVRLPEDRVRFVASPVKVLKINGYAKCNGADLEEGASLNAAAVIEVEEESFVTLLLDDGSIIILEPNSRVHIGDLRDLPNSAKHVIFNIESGRMEVDVVSQKPGARFEISTPTATTAVRGTRFRTSNQASGVTITEVLDGQVDVSLSAQKSAKQRVTRGQGLIAASGDTVLRKPEALLASPDLSNVAELYTRIVVDLTFPEISGAASYWVWLARDPKFTDVVTSVQHDQPNIKIANLADGRYYLRARGISKTGLHGFDGQTSFVLHARPEAPFVSAPALNARLTSLNPVQLVWSSPQNATFYSLEIEKDGAPFAHVEENAPTHYSFSAPPGNYRWRLATHDTNRHAGPFSDWMTFSVIDPPQGPRADFDLTDDDKCTLTWQGDAGDIFYWQLARGNDFEKTLVAEGTTITPTLSLDGLESGVYFVRIRTVTNDGIESIYGDVQQFEIPKNEPSPLWLLLLCLPLVLL